MKMGLFLNLAELPPVFFVSHDFMEKQGRTAGILLMNMNNYKLGNFFQIKERPIMLENLEARLDYCEFLCGVTNGD